MIFRNRRLDRERVAHDLALVCVMKDASAITPDQVLKAYEKHLLIMMAECKESVGPVILEEELVRPC